MKLSWFGRLALALFASLALGLGMSACGGGTIAYLWVLGQQYHQIAAFKVDDYTGNLTQTPHQPFDTTGANPVTILVKTGGRFVYVLNQGVLPSACTSASTCTTQWTSSGIAEFSVGGDGSLTYQQTFHSEGYEPVWMQFDGNNSFLYVLDRYSSSGDGNGSLTAFSIDPTTGRLTLVLNNQSVPPNSPAPTYWEVGQNPLMMKSLGGCLFTVNSADQSITPYSESRRPARQHHHRQDRHQRQQHHVHQWRRQHHHSHGRRQQQDSAILYRLELQSERQQRRRHSEPPRYFQPGLLVHRQRRQQQHLPVHLEPVHHEHDPEPALQLDLRLPRSEHRAVSAQCRRSVHGRFRLRSAWWKIPQTITCTSPTTTPVRSPESCSMRLQAISHSSPAAPPSPLPVWPPASPSAAPSTKEPLVSLAHNQSSNHPVHDRSSHGALHRRPCEGST